MLPSPPSPEPDAEPGPGAPPATASLTCPRCGQASEAEMPADACVYFYTCPGCATVLRPKAGDCCVFCSYGTVRCPPARTGR